jgi:hypothetical protein
MQIRPHDYGATRYVELIRRYRQEPPPTQWNGTIELTEK